MINRFVAGSPLIDEPLIFVNAEPLLFAKASKAEDRGWYVPFNALYDALSVNVDGRFVPPRRLIEVIPLTLYSFEKRTIHEFAGNCVNGTFTTAVYVFVDLSAVIVKMPEDHPGSTRFVTC